MSKYRIKPVDSTLDPLSFERSVAGNQLRPESQPYLNSKPELETLTPFQIEEGQGTLGNSSYQQQAFQNQLAEDEGFWSLSAKGLKNLAGTFVSEVGKFPGYVGGVAAATGNEVFGDGKDSMKMMVDNSWVNAFESLDKSIKDWYPVNIKQDVLDGNLGDKLSSGAWWATSGAEGVGFLLSMYGPGALIKAGKIGQRVMGGIEALANAGQDISKFAGLSSDLSKGFKYSLNTARNVDGYTAAITNSVVESAAEAANTFDNVKEKSKNQFLQAGMSEAEAEQLANQDAGKAAAAVFKTNMVILPVSNLLEEKWLWKSIGLTGGDEVAEGLISKFMKNGVLDIDGLKNATKKTFKQNLIEKSSTAGKNILKEGFGEEGLQTVTQQQVEKGNIQDNPFTQLKESISKYTEDFANNKELHESIFLGGLLGAGSSIFQTINEAKNTERAIYGSTAPSKFNTVLNKIGLKQTQKDQRGLSNLLSENWIQNYRSYNDLLVDGKLDEKKLAELPEDQAMLANLHFLYDSAVQLGDKKTQEVVGQYLSANYVKPFLGQTGGQEVFNQHVENQVVPQWQNRFKEVTGREASESEIEDYKNRFTKSANQVFENYKKVENTHYPERYFQDKNDPNTYANFKQHYFNQKFQALTNVVSVESLISQSQANLASNGIIEGSTLNGIQKTIKKLEDANIANYTKTKEEAEQYYESLFTKDGVKDLYDIFKAQQNVINEVKEDINKNINSDIKVGEQKVEDIQNAEQNLENQINTDQPVYVKNAEGRILESFLQDGQRMVIDDGVVRPLDGETIINEDIKPIQPEDVERELEIANTIQDIPETQVNELPLDELQHEAFLQNDLGTGLYPSTGMHIQYSFINDKILDELTPDGLPKINDSIHQQNWFKTIDKIKNINEYSVKVVNRTNANPEELKVILENAGTDLQDTDLFIFLHQNDEPVIIDSNPVFTSLWRPTTLYKTLSKQALSSRIAPKTVINSYLNSIGIQDQDFIDDDLSNFNDVELAKLETNITKAQMSEQGLWRKASQWAKDDYTQWYNSLQQPNTFLIPSGITKGKRLVRRNENREIVWNKVQGNIPGFSIKKDKLIGGDLIQQYTAQGIQVGSKYYNIGIGDSAIVAGDNFYRLKSSLLNDNEVRSVLYLLSLKEDAPQESVTLPVQSTIKERNNTGGYSIKTFDNTPVFGNNTEYGLIKSLINFGYGTKPGNIYLNGNNIEFVDFNNTPQSIPVNSIKQAFLTDDFSSITNLIQFLNNKKFNVNENLLKADSDYQYPEVKRNTKGEYNIEFSNKGKYKAYLLQSEKLLTDSIIDPRYPNRLSRNLQFAKSPTIKLVENIKESEYDVANFISSEKVLSENYEDYYSAIQDMTSNISEKLEAADLLYPYYQIEEINIDTLDLSKKTAGFSDNASDYLKNEIKSVQDQKTPILVNGRGEVVEGWHRIHSLKANGIKTIKAYIPITKLQKTKESEVKPESKLDKLRSRKKTELPNLADKILSPVDLLKEKLQNGEITKYCK